MLRYYFTFLAILLGATHSYAQSGLSSAETAIERTPAGTPYSTDLPASQITSWNDTNLRTWLINFQESLGLSHTGIDFHDPENLQFREIYGQESYYFESTYSAIGLANTAQSQEEFDTAWYVLAGNCQRFDPWACFNLAMLSMQHPSNLNIPDEIRFDIFRRAADADYTMATHWLIKHEEAVPNLWSVKDQEIYLRRARDIDADFARPQLAAQLGAFYVDHPELNDEGYLGRAISVLREHGEDEYADWLADQTRN